MMQAKIPDEQKRAPGSLQDGSMVGRAFARPLYAQKDAVVIWVPNPKVAARAVQRGGLLRERHKKVWKS